MSTKTFTGACLCKKIKYQIELPANEPLPKIITCHCHNCKRYTGSAFSSNIIVPQTAFKFTQGQPKLFMDDTDNGPKLLRRQFCGDCGSPFTSEPTSSPDIIAIKSGTLDDPGAFGELGMEIYHHRKDKFLDGFGDEKVKRMDGGI